MNNLFRGLLSGIGAWKLGGGCLGTIVVFIVIWLLLGTCSWYRKFNEQNRFELKMRLPSVSRSADCGPDSSVHRLPIAIGTADPSEW